MHRTRHLARAIGTSPIPAGVALACFTLLAPGPLAAQALGFLFNQPAHSLDRPIPRRPTRSVATIPLPVPRPRFAGDAPAGPPAIVTNPPEPPVAARPQAAPSTPAATNSTQTAPLADGEDSAVSDTGVRPKGPAGRAVAPSGADAAFDPRQPVLDAACPGRLAASHVAAEPATLGPQPDTRCTVVQPVRLSDVTLADGLKVTFPDHPTIACETADTFARYVRELLVPLARGSYGSPVDAVWTGPGLECRARDHVFGAKLSAHGQGLAIDIAQLKLADGRKIEVGDPRTPTDQGFESAARAAACGYFHTTLGPGTDSYHRSHWHFDLEQRGRTGDGKYCK